eukprot:6209122-Pleurochrysis_carterae.AAC.7
MSEYRANKLDVLELVVKDAYLIDSYSASSRHGGAPRCTAAAAARSACTSAINVELPINTWLPRRKTATPTA